MSRRNRGLNIHGIVLLDKPVGLSSNRALQRTRGIFQARKAGHTGSLDPFATGMLPVCLGDASKTASFMLEAGKQYRATACFGEATSTGDIEGEISQSCSVPHLDQQTLDQTLARFMGEIEQVPPMYSALKHQGKPLYQWARAGVQIERAPRQVTIHQLDLVAWQSPLLIFDVQCSKGTYIRTLAEDIAKALNNCAHLIELRRNFVEPFENHKMVTLEQLQVAREEGELADYLLPADAGLVGWPEVELDEVQRGRFMHGNRFSLKGEVTQGEKVRVYSAGGQLLGLAQIANDNELRPLKVFDIS